MKPLTEQSEQELSETMLDIARAVKLLLPANTGFIVLASPFGMSGVAQYIANGQRPECIQWLKETAERLEKREDNERTPFK